ncbi:CopD family protein [Roseicella aerolata]|uniref:CopD family protein n=1 Tax=Roseicella aerolata TaxID=2883479 RepID=A0A9X1I8H1_9PROT|nr:CopD family protein [Roseicella aerolata]MCB4820185.1 CopD family protein [Roseicella aerolata]
MDLLPDLHGAFGVVLHAGELAARTALLGSVAFWVLLALPLAPWLPPGDAGRLRAIGRGAAIVSAIAALALTCVSAGLALLVLAATLDAPLGSLLGADFVRAAALALAAILALLALAAGRGVPGPARRAALLAAALALLAGMMASSHAMARTQDRAMLLAATGLHQLGAALWLGGLPALLASLRLTPGSARRIGQRYSALAAAGVGLILLGAAGYWLGYIGEVGALYETAYGALSATKAVMVGLLLLLGASNWLLLHRLPGAERGLARLRCFVESEILIGIAVLAAAAASTAMPPAADMPGDRVTWAEVTQRFTPALPWPEGPRHGDPALTAPQAATSGEGPPPRQARDTARGGANHRSVGLVLLLAGLAALLDATGRVPLTRHWPLAFLGLAGLILLRADPEAAHSLLAGLLVAGLAIAEWGARLGRITGRARAILPSAMLAGGVLLLAQTAALAHGKEALLVRLPNLPLAVLAVAGGCARFAELRGPADIARLARWIWPACLVLIGLLLVLSHEA